MISRTSLYRNVKIVRTEQRQKFYNRRVKGWRYRAAIRWEADVPRTYPERTLKQAKLNIDRFIDGDTYEHWMKGGHR